MRTGRILLVFLILMGSMSMDASALEPLSGVPFLHDAADLLFPSLKDAAGQASKLFGLALLTGIAESFLEKGKAAERVFRAGAVFSVFLLLFSDSDGFFASIRTASDDVMTVIRTALPALAGAAAISGKSASALSSEAVYLLSADVASSVIRDLLLPAAAALLILSAAAAAFQNDMLKEGEKSLHGLLTFFLRITLTVFVGYTGVVKVFGTAGDGAAKRSLRLAISSSVPVVGSIASEAADSILVMASVTRSTVGSGAVAALVAAVLSPLIRLGVYSLVFRVFSFLIAPMGGDGVSEFIRSVSEVYTLLFAMTASLLLLGILVILSVFLYVGT